MSEGVRFIRVRGRVVPIKASESSNATPKPRPKQHTKKTSNAGLAVAGLGFAASVVGAGIGGRYLGKVAALSRKFGPARGADAAKKFSGMYANQMPKKYRAIHSPLINQDAAAISTFMPRGLDEALGGPGSSSFSKRRIFVSAMADEGIFAHELGHARKSLQKGSWNYTRRKQIVMDIRKQKKAGVSFDQIKNRPATDPFTLLASEAEATIEGFRLMKNRYGTRGALKRSKELVISQSTYPLLIGSPAAIVGGAGYQAYEDSNLGARNAKKRR